MFKKFLFSIVLATGFLLSSKEVNAQISIGPRLGLNMSKFAFSDGEKALIKELEKNKKSLPGPHAGLILNIEFTKAFSVQPELLFSQKGIIHEDNGLKFTATRNYLEMPLLAKFAFGNQDIKFIVNAGPYAAFLLSGENREGTGNSEFSRNIDFEYHGNESRQNRWDFGLLAGAGVSFQAGVGKIAFEYRYELGLADMNEYRTTRDPMFPKVSNQTWGTSISYLYPLSH